MSSNPVSKIHPQVAAQLNAGPKRAIVGGTVAGPNVRVIVTHRPAASVVGGPGLDVVATHYRFRLIRATVHTVTSSQLGAIAAHPDVLYIWPDSRMHTMLNQSAPLIGAPQVWLDGPTGKGIKVAVVDTGLDFTHPDLAGRVAAHANFSTDHDATDGFGHGTHVASIIGGTGQASQYEYRGIAPDCSYMIVKVLDKTGSGNMSDVIAGIQWAVEQGAQVINLSLGSDGASDGTSPDCQACDAATARGVVVCVAAGNSGPGAGTVGSPGAAKTVITVGAASKIDTMPDFSSRGPTADGRVKPDVCMPGMNIVAARAAGTSMGTPQTNQCYTMASGTSMATPHATGACALLLQAQPSLKPADVKALLMQTAKDLGLDPNTEGKGRAQLFAAYQSISAPASPTTPAPTPGPAPQPPALLGSWLALIRSWFTGQRRP